MQAAPGRWDDPNVLADVTAVLYASATLKPVVEAFSLSAFSAPAIVAPAAPSADQAAWSALTDPSIDTPADPQASRSLTVLETLATFSRAELARWADDPSAVSQLIAAPPTAAQVSDWWASADAAAQARLLDEAPRVVGNLEGVPYPVRDAANRRFLGDEMASIESTLSAGTAGRAATEQLRAQLHMLQQIEAAVAPGESAMRRSLVNLDAEDGGKAVIVVGDLARADYVTFLVPGMFYSVDSEIGSWADAADQLAAAEEDWLARLTPAQHAGTRQTVATVAWIGYQTPTVVNVASLDLARQGRDALTSSLRGLTALRGDHAPYVSVLAHSYGATAALLALQENDITVDALAMVGSPGSPAGNVGALRVRDGNVWVADAELDPIASSGVFGSQPLSDTYGAHHFGVDGARDPVTGRELAASVGHVDYFTQGSESFRNMALIAIGQGGLVIDPSGNTAAFAQAAPVARAQG